MTDDPRDLAQLTEYVFRMEQEQSALWLELQAQESRMALMYEAWQATKPAMTAPGLAIWLRRWNNEVVRFTSLARNYRQTNTERLATIAQIDARIMS